MKQYTVTYDDGVHKTAIPHDLPDRLPQPGDVYKWTRPGRTLGGFDYRKGEIMTVVERTGHAPFRRTSELGNLLVNGPHGTSVWTAFEHCIATGDVVLVEKP